jgi:uncharacterized OB-fold protein
MSAADWTAGEEAVAYQRCARCAAVWYFARGFCPRCGAAPPETHRSSGRGTVCASTLVTRAPSEALRSLAPYRIVLVDAEEGFRLMAHGALDLAIGDAVAVRFIRFGTSLIPFFEKSPAA